MYYNYHILTDYRGRRFMNIPNEEDKDVKDTTQQENNESITSPMVKHLMTRLEYDAEKKTSLSLVKMQRGDRGRIFSRNSEGQGKLEIENKSEGKNGDFGPAGTKFFQELQSLIDNKKITLPMSEAQVTLVTGLLDDFTNDLKNDPSFTAFMANQFKSLGIDDVNDTPEKKQQRDEITTDILYAYRFQILFEAKSQFYNPPKEAPLDEQKEIMGNKQLLAIYLQKCNEKYTDYGNDPAKVFQDLQSEYTQIPKGKKGLGVKDITTQYFSEFKMNLSEFQKLDRVMSQPAFKILGKEKSTELMLECFNSLPIKDQEAVILGFRKDTTPSQDAKKVIEALTNQALVNSPELAKKLESTTVDEQKDKTPQPVIVVDTKPKKTLFERFKETYIGGLLTTGWKMLFGKKDNVLGQIGKTAVKSTGEVVAKSSGGQENEDTKDTTQVKQVTLTDTTTPTMTTTKDKRLPFVSAGYREQFDSQQMSQQQISDVYSELNTSVILIQNKMRKSESDPVSLTKELNKVYSDLQALESHVKSSHSKLPELDGPYKENAIHLIGNLQYKIKTSLQQIALEQISDEEKSVVQKSESKFARFQGDSTRSSVSDRVTEKNEHLRRTIDELKDKLEKSKTPEVPKLTTVNKDEQKQTYSPPTKRSQ